MSVRYPTKNKAVDAAIDRIFDLNIVERDTAFAHFLGAAGACLEIRAAISAGSMVKMLTNAREFAERGRVA